MKIGLTMLIISMCYFLLTGTTYYSKKRVENRENQIYNYLLITTFLGIVLEMCCIFVVPHREQMIVINYVVNRLFLSYILTWVFIFTKYIFAISFNNKKPLSIKYHNNKKRISTCLFIGYIVSLLLVFYLPLNYYYDGVYTYSFGQATNFLYYVNFILITLWIICLVLNYKEVGYKKYIPLIGFIFGAVLNMIVREINPGILLITVTQTFISVMMYFTIENPDMKLLEEAHKAKEVSDSANEEKTLFVYNLTQEIRSITGKINEDTDIILDSKDYEEIHDSARDIKASTSKFTSMTNDILDVSTIDSANIKIYSNKYNIKNLIKQLVNVYWDICKNKELSFRTNIDHDIPEELYGDGINLKEVLNTILSNSTKYTQKGFVELSVSTIIKNDVCRIIFTIEDSGPGIKSEDINKIKIDNKSLSKANKMVTLMNGTMLISSDYGVGTKVKVILDQKIAASEQTEVAKYESTFENISLLAVDDNEAGIKIIEKLLKGTNIKLDIVSNGKDCLDKLRIGKYNIVLLDEDLSQISGTELMIKIREIRNFNAPVILLTKDNSYEYNEEDKKIGFADYILKPLKKETLLEKIDKYTKKENTK